MIKESLSRVITIESKDGKLRVTRERTSEGRVQINIWANDSFIMLTDKDLYEQQAYKLAGMIDNIANNKCLLPE
ncbi:hypothetical protein LCGC14_1975930 [marine sediment metagenome]|uniref:Uncharacterized protein n=1 Tax=marine sediment metagenome TaxID=412755 RepID=A0A0F9FAT9_9ZZZZ